MRAALRLERSSPLTGGEKGGPILIIHRHEGTTPVVVRPSGR